MKTLAAQQEALAALLRRSAPVVGDPEASALAERVAVGDERMSSARRVDVYREQFFLRHVGVLRDDFAAVAHLLGDDAFDALARRYLEAHPPESSSLRDLGHALPAFVTREAPYAGDLLLEDLARFEWAFVEAFDAADAPPLDAGALAAIPEHAWEDARVIMHPAVRLLALRTPAHRYRTEARASSSRSPDAAPRPPFVDDGPAWIVVRRGPEKLAFAEEPEEAFGVLASLAEGAPLGLACARGAEASLAPGSFAASLGAWFQRWTAWGIFTRVER